MASHHDIPAPVTPTTANTRSPPSFFRNHFNNVSLLSLSSIRSLLPRYSVIDTASPTSESAAQATGDRESLLPAPSSWNSNTQFAIDPPRYSLPRPSHSSMLSSRRGSTATRFEVDGESPAHEFRYSYPIRPKNPWATLHLHTRDPTPGVHSKSLQNQPRVPRFWSCDPITGTVLDLDTPQNIQLISITVCCQCRFILL